MEINPPGSVVVGHAVGGCWLRPVLQPQICISSASYKACAMARSTSALPPTLERVFSNLTVVQSCSTGYGRPNFAGKNSLVFLGDYEAG